MTLLVRDEEDVVEANLLFHLSQGVDFVVVTDNESTDATPQILERYRRMGHVHVIHQAGDLEQAKWVTRMARMAATDFGADWVINNDADEFWWPRSPALDLKDIFSIVPDEVGALLAPRATFVPHPDGPGFFADRIVHRRVPPPRFRKGRQGHPKTAHRARADVTVGRSNHRVRGPGLTPLPGWHPISILHFPTRDMRRFEEKKLHHGAALERTGVTGSAQVERYRRHRSGAETISALYRRRIVDDEAAAVGTRRGRLARDERLKRFFAARAWPPSGAEEPDAAARRVLGGIGARDDERIALERAELVEDMLLAFEERARAAVALERLEAKLERSERKRAEARARAASRGGGLGGRLASLRRRGRPPG